MKASKYWIYMLHRETRAKPGLCCLFDGGLPSLEAFAQITIERLSSGLQDEVSASGGPAHLLLFDHAL